MTLSARDLLTLRSLPDAWTVADLARLRCIERDSAQHLADHLEKKAAIAKEGRFYRTLPIDLCAKPPPKPRAARRACPPNAAECGTWKMPKKTQAGAPLALGPTVPLYDSEGRSYAAQWAIIDLSDLAPSHRSDSTATPGYPLELQARDRGAAASRLQIQALASTLNAARLISPSSSPTDSAPIVWSPNQAGPFFVVSGNGRAMALRQWLTTSPANVAAYWLAILGRWKWPAQADMNAQRRANSGPPIACVRIVTGTRAQAVQLARAQTARTTKPKAAEAPAPAPAQPVAAPSPPPRDPFPPELREAFALERRALNRLNAALKLIPFRFFLVGKPVTRNDLLHANARVAVEAEERRARFIQRAFTENFDPYYVTSQIFTAESAANWADTYAQASPNLSDDDKARKWLSSNGFAFFANRLSPPEANPPPNPADATAPEAAADDISSQLAAGKARHGYNATGDRNSIVWEPNLPTRPKRITIVRGQEVVTLGTQGWANAIASKVVGISQGRKRPSGRGPYSHAYTAPTVKLEKSGGAEYSIGEIYTTEEAEARGWRRLKPNAPAPATAPAPQPIVVAPDEITGLLEQFTSRNKFELIGSKRGPGLIHNIQVGYKFIDNGVEYVLTEIDRKQVSPLDPDEDDGYAPHVLRIYGKARRVTAPAPTPASSRPELEIATQQRPRRATAVDFYRKHYETILARHSPSRSQISRAKENYDQALAALAETDLVISRASSDTDNPAQASWVQLGTRIDLDLDDGRTIELPAGAVLVTLPDYSDLAIAYMAGPPVSYSDAAAEATWQDFHEARTPGPTRAASTLDYGPTIGRIKAIRYDCEHGGQHQRRLHYFDRPLPVAFGTVKKIGIQLKNERLRVTNRGIIG